MDSLLAQIEGMVAEIGPHAYIGIIGMAVIWLTGFLAVFLLIYSAFSHNWQPWKYLKKSFLAGLGLVLLGILTSFVIGLFKNS